MATHRLINRLCGHLRAFRSAKAGNVMFTFALATVPLVGAVGAAVDYSRANSDRAAMQAAVDATALMLSKGAAGMTQAQLNSQATAYFNANFSRTDVTNLAVTPIYTSQNGTQLVLTATGTVKTTFMKVLGL